MSPQSSFSFFAQGVPAIATLGGILLMVYGVTINMAGGDGTGTIILGFFVFIIGVAVFLLSSRGGGFGGV